MQYVQRRQLRQTWADSCKFRKAYTPKSTFIDAFRKDFLFAQTFFEDFHIISFFETFSYSKLWVL